MIALALVLMAAAVLALAVQVRRLRADIGVLAARLEAVRIVDEATRRIRRATLRPVPDDDG